MTEDKLQEQTIRDMVYLCACAIHHQLPEKKQLQQMDFGRLYSLSRFHSLTAITAMALEDGGAFQLSAMPPELAAQWQQAKAKAIRKNLLLDAGREKICQYMEQSGIWYMPLKGSVLKALYPRLGMRQMADNDILYDSHFQNQMLSYMKTQGYHAENVGKSNHDVYHKPPVYNFELHTSLFGAAHRDTWGAYYENVRERLILTEGTAYGYHFTDEDFYLYMMTHACKHFDGGGTGLRSLLDCYVYLWRKGEGLDWLYIRQESEKLGIRKFEESCRSLSQKLFVDPECVAELLLTNKEQKFLSEFTSSGTYGTSENRVKKKLHTMQPDESPIHWQTKGKYLLCRLFPDRAWFRQYYPFCDRHPVIIPFFCVFRVFRGIFLRSSRIWREVKALRKTK